MVEIRDMPVRAGAGPVLVTKDNMTWYSAEVRHMITAAARRAGVKLQHAAFGVDGSYSSDGTSLIRNGVQTALLAFPTRYTHSPFEMVHSADLSSLVDLLIAFLQPQ